MKKNVKDLSRDEVKALYQKNDKLWEYLYDRVWDTNQFYVSGEISNYVGNDRERGYKYHNDHSSFFLSLEDPEEFLRCLRDNATDRSCFTEEFNCRLDAALKTLDEWEEMNYEEQTSDRGDEVYDKMYKRAEDLLSQYESVLHSYENISDEELIDEFYYLVEDELENDYTDGVNIYEHIDGRYVPSHEQLVY